MHVFRSCFTDHLKDQLKKTTEKVVWLHSLEDLPFTLNNHYLSDYARKFLSRYTGHRQRHLHGHVAQLERYKPPSPQSEEPSSNHQIKAVLTNLVALGFPAPKPVDLYRVLPPDEMEIALDIMANVRAYFQGRSFLFRLHVRCRTFSGQWRINDTSTLFLLLLILILCEGFSSTCMPPTDTKFAKNTPKRALSSARKKERVDHEDVTIAQCNH